MSLASVNKTELFQEILSRLEHDLTNVTAAQKSAQEGATHEENRSESDKDMRATEVSYVARGQAERVRTLREEIALLRSLVPRPYDANTPLAAGALLTLEENGRLAHHLLLPVAGGVVVTRGTRKISVLTTRSPLGQNVLGARLGDIVGLDSVDGSKEYEVVEVA